MAVFTFTRLCRSVPSLWIYLTLILTIFIAKLMLYDTGLYFLNHPATERTICDECDLLVSEMSTRIRNVIQPGDFFYDLNPLYRHEIATIRHRLQSIKDVELFKYTASALLSNSSLNQRLVSRAVLGAILDRDDRADFRLPSLMSMEPDSFLPAAILSELPTQLEEPLGQTDCVLVDEWSATTHNGDEDKLWYFRQDPLVNTHHLFWHAFYPHNAQHSPLDAGRRRGELFYFMHHDFLARYHAERLSNGLQPVTPWILTRGAVVEEAFETPLIQKTGIGKLHWVPRPHNQTIADSVEATFANVTISETLLWGRRLRDSIAKGELVSANGSAFSILNIGGINWIVNTIEAVLNKSANSDYYGEFGYHNGGHVFIGNVMHPHDPNGTYSFGPMTDTAVAMRDLIFYRWHAHIEDLFQTHKAMLSRYEPRGGEFPLLVRGIHIESILVQEEDASSSISTANVLHTFWGSAKFELNYGLALHSKSEIQTRDEMELVPVCVKHLDHKPFFYNLTVMSGRKEAQAFTVRIYMAPRYNQNGLRYTMAEQHKLFFVLDLFRVRLRPGLNTILRKSVDSTLTVESVQHTESTNVFDMPEYCGCGWPAHMLLPKGGAAGKDNAGMEYDLLVIITHEDENASTVPFADDTPRNRSCKEAFVYCGAMDAIYPDAKPMGYPLDRLPYTGVHYLEDYIRGVAVASEDGQQPNLASTQVTIRHQEDEGNEESN